MDLPVFIEVPLRLALLVAGLILPGAMILRALRLPWSLAASFTVSAVTLYLVVLAFWCTGLPIALANLAAALGVISLAGRAVPVRPGLAALPPFFSSLSRMGFWLPLYLVFWGVVGYRLITQPLSGPDVYFRWSYLAEQIVQFGSLDFYPPRTGADFARYFWAESVPPGIASLYAWAYACAGSKHALWTSPVVALQLLALHELIWRLAGRWGGEIAARRALLLAAACPLLTWSFLIGQETGLTAVAVCGLVWCLYHLPESDGSRWAVLGGLFAVAAASTREYGPVFSVAAVAATVILRAPRRHTLMLAVVALPLAAAWPLRVWALAGNPIYSLDLAGLFPTNPVFVEWTEAFHAPHAGTLVTAANWSALGRYFLLWALPATAGLVALLALLFQRLREARAVALLVALVVALWALSVSHTAGGLFYSLRVLSPAFALLMVVAAYGLGYFVQHVEAVKYATAVVALVLLESLPKTLVLPENPYQVALPAWPRAGRQFTDSVRARDPDLLAKVLVLPGQDRVLSDNAGLPRVFAPIKVGVLPLWSPEVAWLFDASLKPAEVARRWKKSGLRYVIVGKSGPASDFMRTHARWRAPYFKVAPVAETENYLILEATVP